MRHSQPMLAGYDLGVTIYQQSTHHQRTEQIAYNTCLLKMKRNMGRQTYMDIRNFAPISYNMYSFEL